MTTNDDSGTPATGNEAKGNEPNVTYTTSSDPNLKIAGGSMTGSLIEVKDWKAEHDKAVANSRKWEDRAKANSEAAKQLDELKRQSMTDLERAVDEAKATARAEALREVAAERVADAVRVAAAGRNVDVDALLEAVDTNRFANDDGTPNKEAVTAWLDKVSPALDPNAPIQPASLDLGQGARGQPLALNGDPLEQALRNAVGAKR